jgi:hypothetical protein
MMSLGIFIQCDCVDPVTGKDCESKIHIKDKIDLAEPMPRDYRLSVDLGHMVLLYARGHQQDLNAAAIAAGWHHDGREWACKSCLAKRWQQIMREEAIIRASGGRPATRAELVAQMSPTIQKLEAVAKLLNV